VLLAAAAARTSRIRLTTGVTILGVLDPVRVYQDFATVDLISRGRAEMTVGRSAFVHARGGDRHRRCRPSSRRRSWTIQWSAAKILLEAAYPPPPACSVDLRRRSHCRSLARVGGGERSGYPGADRGRRAMVLVRVASA
jgi:hypothetical protein